MPIPVRLHEADIDRLMTIFQNGSDGGIGLLSRLIVIALSTEINRPWPHIFVLGIEALGSGDRVEQGDRYLLLFRYLDVEIRRTNRLFGKVWGGIE